MKNRWPISYVGASAVDRPSCHISIDSFGEKQFPIVDFQPETISMTPL